MGDANSVADARMPEAMYFVVVAARETAALAAGGVELSLFTEQGEGEWRRIDAQAREVLRLDLLLKDRDQAADRQTAHIQHLERLVAERDRIVFQRDAELADARAAHLREVDAVRGEHAAADAELSSVRQRIAALDDERERLERAISAQERIIAYRQSARWWLKLPWLRARGDVGPPEGRAMSAARAHRSTSSSPPTTRRTICAAASRASLRIRTMIVA